MLTACSAFSCVTAFYTDNQQPSPPSALPGAHWPLPPPQEG